MNGGTGDAGTAWTTYTPTVSSQSGTITTASATGRFKTLGKTCHVQVVVTVTTNGTGAGTLNATLPAGNVPAAAAILVGRENALTGNMLQALVNSGDTVMHIGRYDNAYPATNGSIVIVSGIYETT